MPIPSRRTFVSVTGLGAAVVLAGGAGVAAEFIRHPTTPRSRRGPSGTTPSSSAPPRDPGLENALARERRLLATLAHAATTTPALSARIAVLRADHQAHAAALAALVTAAGVTTTTKPSVSPPATAVATPARVADLVRWEKAAAVAIRTDFDRATGPEAAVLASIYACEQTHVAWLT